MSEADEIAAAIWRSRSALDGSGLNTTAPIRSWRDAQLVAKSHAPDLGAKMTDNVADALFAQAIKAGTVRGVGPAGIWETVKRPIMWRCRACGWQMTDLEYVAHKFTPGCGRDPYATGKPGHVLVAQWKARP